MRERAHNLLKQEDAEAREGSCEGHWEREGSEPSRWRKGMVAWFGSVTWERSVDTAM